MNTIDPLSDDALSDLFRISDSDTTRIIKREDSRVEFKTSYSHAGMAEYFRTIASFANNKGGYIIFGIGNNPRSLIGLKNKKLEQFEGLKTEEFTKNLCEYFAPEIKWSHVTYDFLNLKFGVIYVYPLEQKPAVCKKVYDHPKENYSLKEGDIYYRYGGRSEKIHYTELLKIIDENRNKEEEKWLKFLTKASKIGINNAYLLDIESGFMSGNKGQILIDESILKKIAFIREGEFNEVSGKPTLKLIGDVKVCSQEIVVLNDKASKKPIAISDSEIIEKFLNNIKVESPKEYIKQICHSTTGYLPVYYYINLANITKEAAIDIIEQTISRSQAKNKLLERIKGKYISLNMFSNNLSAAAREKIKYKNHWLNKGLYEPIENLNYCLQSLFYVTDTEFKEHSSYIRKRLFESFKTYYENADSISATNFRKAICRLDEALYLDSLPKERIDVRH